MSDLREQIRQLGPWHHDIEVADGIRTGEFARAGIAPELGKVELIRPDVYLPLMLADVFPDGLAGRSILDCACNAGGYLFAAKDLGAGRAFGFDVREHWIRQAQFVQSHRHAPDLAFARCDLADLPSRNLGRFDVTLFLGLLYHLPDPVAGLRIAAEHTNELLLVNTAISPRNHAGLVLAIESETYVMSGVHRLAWLPTGARVVREMLAWCGFPHTRVQFEGKGAHGPRVQVIAAREERVLASYDAKHATATQRKRRWLPWRRT